MRQSALTLDLAVVDCCAPIQVPGAGLRLEERSFKYDFGSDKFTLYECPSCGAFWVAHDAFWDHGTWYRKEYIRVADAQGFEALLASARAGEMTDGPVPPRARQLTPLDITRAFQIATTIGRKEGHETDE